jgi:hypothetical protein
MGKLGQVLVARGWITIQQLTRALQNQQGVGGRLGTCLLETDAITEEILFKGLSEQLGVPAALPEDLRGIPEEVLTLVPEKLARRCRAVPFRLNGGRLDIALQDPRNLSCQDEIAFACGKRVKVFVGSEVRMSEALERYYREDCPSRFGVLLDRLNRARFLWNRPEAEPEAFPTPVLSPIDLYGPAPLFDPPPLPEPLLPPSPRLAPREARPASPLLPPLSQFELLPAPGSPAPGHRLPERPMRPPAPEPPPVTLATPLTELAGPPPVAVPPPSKTLDTATAEMPLPAWRRDPPSAAPVQPKPAGAAPVVPAPATPARSPLLELTSDEKAELGVIAPAAVPLPSFPTYDEFEQAMKATEDREEIGRLLLGFLRRDYRRAALFQALRDRVSAWMADGEGLDSSLFSQFSVDFRKPSVFLNLKQGSGMHLGPLPPMPAHRELVMAWGGALPRDAVVLPVRIKDRLVAVVYAESASPGHGIDLEPMQRLSTQAAIALERAILTRKRSAAKP